MNKMMRTVMCALCVAMGALGAFAATKTVTWSLPADWEGNVELDQICEPVGAPSVAYYNALIEVPATATNFVITASDVAYRASELARLTPVLEPSIVGEPVNAPVEDAALYASIYPSDVFEKGEPWEMNGKTVLPVRIKVYRWNGPANKVEALESLKLSIACESPRAALKLKTSSTAGAEDYLILSPSQFVTYWEEFAEYRRGTHPKMTFRVVNVNTEIYANSSYTGDDALKIHQYLEAKYAQGTRYVLLGAGCSKGSYDNTKMIPARYAWVKGASMVCDYYYCVMTKIGQRVWDYDADGVYLANASKQADANWKFSWKGDMKVHRFPARDTVSYAGKTCSAYDQIHGYVNKLKRAEALNFAGRFSNAPLGDQFSDGTDTTQAKSTGNTSVTMEREFFDLGTNLWAPDHGAAIAEQEPRTRDRVYTHMTLQRPVGWNSGVWQCHYQKDTIGTIHNRDYDILLINAHGSTEGSTPLTVADCWKSTGLKRFYIMCVPCHSGNIDYKNNNTGVPICLAEAPVLNPNGGALVSFSNVGYGIYGGRDAYNEKIERDILVALCGTDGKGYRNAGDARLYAQNNYGTPAASGGGGLVMADSMALGDPLVALTPFWSRNVDSTGAWRRGDQAFVSDQDFASTLTINAGSANTTTVISNAIGAAYLNVNGTAGNTVTLDSSANGKFKVTNKVTVNDGVTLNWQVYGGFGRNGISFTNGGNLRLYAGGYYGSDFSGINKLTVSPPSGQKAVVDFDSKNYFRDASGKIGAIEITGAGETVIRSRQAGIFSTNLTIPVTGGGTVTLQTPTVGGNATYASSTKPLFDVQNSSLAIECNPILSNENFTRPLKFTNSNLINKYEKFCFGHTAGSGFDFTISGDNNTISGMQPVKLNGELRIWAPSTGKLNVTATLSNGSITGSLRIKSGATVRLAGVNTFTGGIVVESGARLIVADKSALGSGALTVKAGGVLEVETMPLNNVRQITIENTAKLVVHGQGQLFNPNVTTWKAGSGMEIYSSEGGVETKVDAVITTEGAFFNPAAALTWREGCGLNWVNDSSVLAWTKNGVNTGFTNGEGVYIKDSTTSAAKITIPVSGAINPSIITFNNGTTPVEFTSANSASITSDAISTMGETTFNPPVTANSRFTAGGKTTVSTLTTKTVTVPSGGALNVTGSVNGGAETITVIRFHCTDIMRWSHCTVGESEKPMEISEFRCFSDASGNSLQFFPVGTVITDNAGRSVKITGMSSSGTAYVFGEESGGTTLKNLFDGNLSTVHAVAMGTKGPWTITVTMPTPIPMIKSFRFGTGNRYTSTKQYYAMIVGNYPCGNPYVWSLSVGNSVDKLTSVLSRTENNTSANTMTGAYSVTQLPSTNSATVQNGGTLYLSGTYNVPVTLNAGATLAVTNTSKATFSGGKAWPSGTFALNIDAKDAKKQSTWFQVTSGAGLTASDWLFKTDDDTAAEVRSGELWVATAGVMAPPYSRSITGENATVNWNTTDWYNGKNIQFTSAWGSSITKPTGMATLNVTGTNLTMNINCSVKLDTLKVTTPTNCYPQSLIVNLASGNTTGISAIDFRGFNGRVTWNPPLASWGTNIYVGTNDVTIASMTSGTGALQIGADGKATVPQKFASYDVDISSYLRFTGTHNFSVDSDLPNKGIQSFNNTTFSGGFQKSAITYLVENDDVLNFTGTSGNNYGRINSSFDIRGGSVTINSNGATTWFGHNGTTTFKQTGGTFTCTANGTGTSGTGNGLLLGYDSSKTMDLAMDIFGGSFLLPNTSINFFGSTVITVTNSAVLQAKGVYMSGSNKGTINVYDNATFELGTIGLVAGACDFNLYGGTLAGFENGAHTRSTVNLVGVGTLAAKANTTFTVDAGTINADGATLNIGVAGGVGVEGYTGTVKLEDIPSGITNITVTAGTWDMGELRPTNDIPVSVLTGKIAAQLTDDELRQAAEDGGFKLIKTSLPDGAKIEDRVAVVTRGGVAVEAMGSVRNGYIYIGVDYVYPLYATTQTPPGATLSWANLDWHDAIGMPFKGDWADVESAVLSNELADVTLVVTNAFTSELTVVNSGVLTLARGAEDVAPYLDTLDDSASTGKTTIGFTANNITAGAETVIKHVGSGTLTLAAGKCAALWNNLDWPSARISGFSGTAKIRYVGDTTLTSLNYTSAAGGIVAYAQKVDMSTGHLQFNNALTRSFEEGLDMKVYRMSNGNQSGTPTETFYQTGGRIEALSAEDMVANPTGSSPLLFAHWPSAVSYYLTGGELIATNGVNGSVYFGRDGVPKLYIGGGSAQATLRTNGLINDSRTEKDKNGSVIELKPNGHLEIGDKGFVLYRNAELRLSGGTFLAYDNAEIKSDTSKFTLTDGTTSYLAAAAGKTLTVSKIPSGTGTIICQSGEGGTVLLKSGDWTNVTLGGKFTYYLTDAQKSATVNVNLFKPADGFDRKNVRFVDSTGTEVVGEICLYNGYVSYVPATGFKMPIVGELYTNSLTSTTYWHDSSDTPRTYPAANLASATEIILNVHSNVTFGCNYTATYPSFRIRGPGQLTLLKNPSVHTLTQCYIETDVISTNGGVTFTAADIAENASLTVPVGKAPGSISGKGTLVSDGATLPTSTGLTDATKWQGTVKLTGTLDKGLDLGTIGNTSSTVEFAGQLKDATTDAYLKIPTTVNSGFVLSGKLKIQNGNSETVHAKFCGSFSGDGTFETAGTAPYKKDVFQITGDASGFAGAITLGCVYHDVAFGTQTYGTGGTIFVGNDKGATIVDGKQWTAPTEIKVQNGGTLNIAARAGETYASPSKVTVVSGGYLNLLQTSEDQLVWRITSNATFTLPTGCLKVNGKVMASDQYSVSGGVITLKACTLTWNGGATGGTWDKSSSTWLNGSSSAVAWSDGFKPGNTAKFNGDTSLTLGATVSPDVIDIRSNAVTSAETGFIPKGEGSKVLVASNMRLDDVTSFSGEMWGGWVAYDGPATAYHITRNGDTVTAQFQKVDGDSTKYVKCVKVTFVQQGNDVYGYVNYAKNVQGTTIPQQFDSTGTDTTVATTDNGDGYGIKKIKLAINSVGNLVVGGAEKFGKAFTVTNGVLTVATGALAQDVTLAAGAKLNIITTDVTNEYVVTSGKVVNGGYANILINGEAIDHESWTLDLDHGKLVRVVQPGVPPFSYTISADSPSPVLWTNQQWLASNLFYVLPEEWTTGTVSEVKLTVDGNVTNTLVANANMTITKMSVLNSGVVEVTNGLVGGDTLGAPFTLNIGTLDDSASSGKTTLNFPLNATAVKAGSDTVLTTTGTGTVTIDAGMQATLYGDAALSRAANTFSFTEGTESYRLGALKFAADGGQGLTALPSGYVGLFKTTGKFVVDRPLSVNGELAFGNADNNLQYSTLDVGPNARLSVTKLHTANGKNYFQGSQNGGIVEVTSTDEGDGERQNAVLFGHWNGASTYNLNYGEMLVAGGIMLGWDSTDGDGTVLNVGAANETKPALVRAASIRGCTSGNANKKAMLKVYPNGILEVKNGVLMAHANSGAKQFVMAGGTLRTTANAEVKLAHAEGVQLAEGTGSTFAATNGTTLTVSAKLSGAGAFFAGEAGYAGTVKLTAQNTFTGNVGVRAGTLDIGGETLRGEVLVAEGATLAITRDGDWGEFTITSGGALNIVGDVSLNGTVLERNGWTVKDGKLVVYKPDCALYWIGSVNTEWNTRDANWKTVGEGGGEGVAVAWEDGHYEGNSAAFTNSATITMSETVRPRAITVDNGQTLTISGPTHFGRAFDLTGALKLAPTSETLYDFEASGSGAITYEGGTITSLWRSTIPGGGLTIASGALSVTNGYFGSEFNVGSAKVFGPTDATLVFDLGAEGAQVIKGTTDAANRHYAIKVVSGTLNFNAGGDNTAFRGRTVAADGTNAVINLATGDATGYGNGGTVIALSNGGTLRVSTRDTLKTPLLFNGGTLELAKDCGGSGRGLDLYGNNNWAVTADSCVTYASETSDNDRKIALRNGDFTIAVEKDVTLTVEAVLAFNNGYGGTEGKLIKTGAGTLEFSADNTYCKGTRIENGTLALDDGASAGTGAIEMSGGMLEFQLGTMTNDIHTTGGIINLVGELPTGEDEVAITTGAMTGEPQVRVNGEPISPSEWMVVGNKLKRVQHIEVSYGVPVTLAAGYEDKPVMFDVLDLAGGTVVVNAERTLGSMAISGEGPLTLKFADEGKLTLVSGFVDPSVIIDATGLARNTLAKRSACGAPYSYWLIRGEASEAERAVELPRMPSGYAIAAQSVAGLGLRLIVTAPDDAQFGVISVNLHNGTVLSGAGDHGLYPDVLANWGNLKVDANNSVTVSNATFTIGESASGWSNGNYADTIQYQYLDDKTFERTVTIGSVPFDQYRVIVYFSTDSRTIPFAPMTVNGVSYSGLDTTTNGSSTVIGRSANWGSTGPQGGHSYELKEGVNALVTDVLTPGTVTLGFTSPGQGTARATPCAIQVVKVGEMVIGEITDYTAEIPSGTTSINFSAIEWEEGPFVDGTNHTVTITAPAGCTIVIDESLTLYSFKVNCTGACTVKVAGVTVSLAQGFLGDNYSINYSYNEEWYGSTVTAFSTGGSTGWTDDHDVFFDYTLITANGLDLRFTGTVDPYSGISIHDENNRGGSVAFGNNLTAIAYLYVGNGTVMFATTHQITIETFASYASYDGHVIMAAKTDEAAIKVTSQDGVALAGVTLDIDTLTEAPIPEDTVQYKLITALSIDITGAKLGSSFKGNWELEVVDNGDGTKTLIAKKVKKGFYFIITKNEQTQETVVAHATDSKRALDIDRAWVVENTNITSDQSKEDEKVTEAINVTGANGAKVWQSYVLGLEPKKAASKPVIAPVQSAAADKVAFRLDNIAVNPRAGANNVKYKVWSGGAPGEKTTASQLASYTDPIAVDLPTSGVRYYHIEVLID